MTGDRISLERRRQIVSMSLAGHSQRTIAREVGCRLSSLNRITQRFRDQRQLEDGPRSGRSRATTSDEDRAIIAANVVDLFLPAVDLKELSLQASSTTIRRRLAWPRGSPFRSRGSEARAEAGTPRGKTGLCLTLREV
ncbi:uncharacterized protein LOC135395851 [Ornithodoros turicata]|uniref:uncharacterized protein LOC135395851 n=1 Tax=Ornithodoros turicata TaxID=34597 RepID=UPI00313A267F